MNLFLKVFLTWTQNRNIQILRDNRQIKKKFMEIQRVSGNVSPPDFSPFDFFPIPENWISQLSTSERRAVVQHVHVVQLIGYQIQKKTGVLSIVSQTFHVT
jgi:hypothetical protein